MRPSILFTPLALLVFAACGGSSSETPWPAEPEGRSLGPAESAPLDGVTDTPDAPAGEKRDRPDAGR